MELLEPEPREDEFKGRQLIEGPLEITKGGRGMINGIMKRYDSNGNEQIDKDEIEKLDDRIRDRISDGDSNGDGSISRQELTDHMQELVKQFDNGPARLMSVRDKPHL